MGYDGYMSYNGVEIINTRRTAAYLNHFGIPAIGCRSCPAGASYYEPASDGAPWMDDAVPWSADFLGFYGLDISGVRAATGVRTPVPRIGYGAVMGQLRHGPREITVAAKGFALSEAGMSWGQSWLANVLEAGSGVPGCQTSCTGVPLGLYAWCPDCQADPVACAVAPRTLFDAAVMQTPEYENKRRLGLDCGRGRPWMWDADFLIGTGLPFGYQPTIPIADRLPFVTPVLWPCVDWVAHTPGSGTCTLPDCSINVNGACMVWTPVGDPACADPCDVYGGQCLADPLCPIPQPPPAPITSADPCVCLISMNPLTTMTNIPVGTVPRSATFVPVMQVSAGSADLRKLLLRFYRASAGEVCTYSNLGNCDVIGEVGIPYLPAGSTLLLDGRQEQAVVTCADGRSASPVLYTTDGPMASWPVMGCADAWCVAVTADGDFVATDAWASVSVAVRDDVW